MRTETTDTPIQPAPNFDEDLAALAEYEFRVAQHECIDCGQYHALFGYARLSKLRDGLEIDGDILTSLLDKLTPMGGRILIAGSADAGLLALTIRATRKKMPKITVADRCATPLAVCRRYLESHGLTAATVQADLAQTELAERYDLIFAHNILPFMPASSRVPFLHTLKRLAADGGTLLLANLVRPAKRDGTPAYKTHLAILDALAAGHIPLPEDEATFAGRVRALEETERARASRKLDLPQIEEDLAAADLHVRERLDHDRRKTTPARDGGEATTMRTYFFLLSAAY